MRQLLPELLFFILSHMDILKDKNLLWLAPLAGFTDNAFRYICKKWGADIVVSEMVSADGLRYSYDQTIGYARFSQSQRPAGIQIFGSDPDIMQYAAQKAAELYPDFIDINMGCPVKKVVKRGAGSALMLDITKAKEIVRKVKSVCLVHNIPLSVKIRSGWNTQNINAPLFAAQMEASGADMIIIHPRTKSQMFAGESDWAIIKAVCEIINIPVIGNGDIKSPHDAADMIRLSNCHGIMIGRGSIGRPWIFREVREFLQNGTIWQPSIDEVIATIKEHYALAISKGGEKQAIPEMRNHLSAYTKGYKDSARLRDFINHSFDYKAILAEIEKVLQANTPFLRCTPRNILK
jgi:tRNA-dihydrouridine synthase B